MKTVFRSTKMYTFPQHVNVLEKALEAKVITQKEAEALEGVDQKYVSGKRMNEKQWKDASVANRVWLFDLMSDQRQLREKFQSMISKAYNSDRFETMIHGITEDSFTAEFENGTFKDFTYTLALCDGGVEVEVTEK